jgi:hypothetical protein
VGYTFVTIWSPKFRKTNFRPNYIYFSAETYIFRPNYCSAENINVKSNGPITGPSICVKKFGRPDNFFSSTFFRPNILSAERLFGRKIVRPKVCLYNCHTSIIIVSKFYCLHSLCRGLCVLRSRRSRRSRAVEQWSRDAEDTVEQWSRDAEDAADVDAEDAAEEVIYCIAFAFSFAFEIYCIRILVCIRNILQNIAFAFSNIAFEILHSHSRLHSKYIAFSFAFEIYCIRILVCIRNIFAFSFAFEIYCIRILVCIRNILQNIAFAFSNIAFEILHSHSRLHSKYCICILILVCIRNIAFAFSFAFEILHSHSHSRLHSKYCIHILVCILVCIRILVLIRNIAFAFSFAFEIYCIQNIGIYYICIQNIAFEILHSKYCLLAFVLGIYCIQITFCYILHSKYWYIVIYWYILQSKYWYILHLHSKYCIRNTVCFLCLVFNVCLLQTSFH